MFFVFCVTLPKRGAVCKKRFRIGGGLTKIRCLAARQNPDVHITISLVNSIDGPIEWKYSIGMRQESRGKRRVLLRHEQIWDKKGDLILSRPDENDLKDEERLTQTHLEQINSNFKFRVIAETFKKIEYLHMVPQLLRYPEKFKSFNVENDPFGLDFLERIARLTPSIQKSRLNKIEDALRIAVPQLKEINLIRDETTGVPHLEANYEHWRAHGSKQREDQFSDGTLRLLGLFWSMLDSSGPLLLEEPELSLNAGIVSQLAPLIYTVQKHRKQQLLITTHSESLVDDKGIDGREVIRKGPRPPLPVTFQNVEPY
ncbi:MAG: ATP-binding protein [Magnetococcus sp. DMHC-6]